MAFEFLTWLRNINTFLFWQPLDGIRIRAKLRKLLATAHLRTQTPIAFLEIFNCTTTNTNNRFDFEDMIEHQLLASRDPKPKSNVKSTTVE